MVHRIALLIAGVAAVSVLVIGIVAAGNGPSKVTTADAATAAPQTAAAPAVKTQTDTVYVRPAPPPQVIHVTKQDMPAATAPAPKTVVVTRTAHSGEHERGDGGHGGGHQPGGDD